MVCRTPIFVERNIFSHCFFSVSFNGIECDRMILNRNVKIWLLVSQFIITIGAGHGIAPMGLVEFIGLSSIVGLDDTFRSIDPVFLGLVCFTLGGQVAILISLFSRRANLKRAFAMIGPILLWLPLLVFAYNTRNDSYTAVLWITVIPLFITSIVMLAGSYIGRFFNKLWNFMRG